MAAAALIDLADAVVATLNGASLSQALRAERRYVPVSDVKDLAALRVTVVPAAVEMVSLSRRDDEFTYAVDVAVQQHVRAGPVNPARERAACDPLVALVAEVCDLFRGGPAAALPARFVGLRNEPIFDPEHLDAWGVFTSVVRLTFKGVRAR